MPIRSDARGNLIKQNQYKKKKYKYRFTCGDESIVGATDDPRRTLESIWKVYWDCKKDICVDLGTRNKTKELCVTQGKETVYTYCNEDITVHKFKQLLDEH